MEEVVTNQIQLVEDYARSMTVGEVAHDFQHADRVRRWALRIAHEEQYLDTDPVEAAALLHDIGLASGGRKQHADVGADLAEAFLHQHRLFSDASIAEIVLAIRSHNTLDDCGTLGAILRDGDILDLLGAVGIMRAFTSKAHMADYPPGVVKGDTWGMNGADFTERFRAGLGVGSNIVDQINFQMSCADNLTTPAARMFAAPLLTFMQVYMHTLEAQVTLVNLR